MPEDFNNQLFFDNITFLLKEKEKRIGEFEAEAGVSAGYISRTTKDEKTKPGIDFIMNAAKALNVSIDMLIKTDLSSLSPTERYLASFIDKLTQNTLANELDWHCESADYLKSGLHEGFDGDCGHPLFSKRDVYVRSGCDYPDVVSGIVFTSASFGAQTFIDGDCFNLNMKDNATLYIMSIQEINLRTEGMHAIEIWMVTDNGNEFICSTKGNTRLSGMIEQLYETVSQYGTVPKVKKEVREVIDSFMNDGREYIPFY